MARVTRSPAQLQVVFFFFFSSRRRHTRFDCDWSSDVCSSDLAARDRRLTRRAEPKHAAGAPARPCRAHARAVAQGPRAAQVCGGSVEGARMRPTADLPDDPRLPGLMAIRDRGLSRAIPALGLEQGGGGGELVLCGYHPGARATLDAP